MSNYGSRFMAGGTTVAEAFGLGDDLDALDRMPLQMAPQYASWPIPISSDPVPQPQTAPRTNLWSFLDKPLVGVPTVLEQPVLGYSLVQGTNGLLEQALSFLPTERSQPVQSTQPKPIPSTPASYAATSMNAPPESWFATPGAKIAGAAAVGGLIYLLKKGAR